MVLEGVEFTCGRCRHDWSTHYDVQQYRDEEGGIWEYFSLDGIAVRSPYTPVGASPCAVCSRHWVGRLQAAHGAAGTPREKVTETASHRPNGWARPCSAPQRTSSRSSSERPTSSVSEPLPLGSAERCVRGDASLRVIAAVGRCGGGLAPEGAFCPSAPPLVGVSPLAG